MNRIVQDRNEVPLVIHSSVTTPIAEMSFLRQALLFAELSMIAYNDQAEATVAAAMAGFTDTAFYDRNGAQAFRFRNDHDCVITCRGTEPHEWNDIRADANATRVLAETVGKVHRGFKGEVDDLWPMLETALMTNEQPLWFAGHSLGGAMATISAGRCFLSHIPSIPEALFSYGSPRVGDKRYINYVSIEHYRFVNNNDIVTRVPPILMGYRHSGREVYLNRKGDIKQYCRLMKRRDRWRGFLCSLRRWKIDHFADHSIHQYIQGILKAVEKEEAERRRGGEETQIDELASAAPRPDEGSPADLQQRQAATADDSERASVPSQL